ncbi:MAG TPA: hypothetical protein H9740_13175 [Candidatus Hungatella pullicola]|nr:hypothetical protein [Candidatus Hungatella pullicola]
METVRENEKLEITIMDNGVGMDKNQLEKMMALLESDEIGVKDEYNWKSVGVKNVNDRIRYLYGEEYGIKADSSPGLGTIVRILLPIQIKGEHYDKDDYR